MNLSDPSAPLMRKGTNAAQVHLSLYRQVSRMGENSLASSKRRSPVRELFFSGRSCRVSISRPGCPFWFFNALLALAYSLTGKLRHLHFALALVDLQNVPILLSFYTQKKRLSAVQIFAMEKVLTARQIFFSKNTTEMTKWPFFHQINLYQHL